MHKFILNMNIIKHEKVNKDEFVNVWIKTVLISCKKLDFK